MTKFEKQKILAENILKNLGYFENIKDFYHCATRMRLTLYNNDLVNVDDLKTISIIKGVLWSNGELQIIIGQEVSQITNLLKSIAQNSLNSNENIEFKTNQKVLEKNVIWWKRFVKAISAIFGPIMPFLIGVGLIMAFQQFLIRTNLASDPTKEGAMLGFDYNIFDYVLNIIAGTGFKMMGVIAIWSTVRYFGGKTPIAIALGLIMISPIIPEAGINLMKIGTWQIVIKPFYSTILVFIIMGIIISIAQKLMEKHFHPIANFILNPFLTLLIGGLLAFFIMGPIMGIVENALLSAFNWFMNLPIGLGAMIVGLTWQPLVVLGVHNILFFAAVSDLSINENPSLFLAAAFAAAWAQMGAAIAVGLKSKKNIDRSIAFAAVVPGVISGPTESCIYGVNLPRGVPFITGTIAGAIGGWLIGIFNVKLDNLAGLGGIVGFLAYTNQLVAAILIDIGSLALGILITYFLWKEEKTEKSLALKTTRKLVKKENLKGKVDFTVQEFIKLIRKRNRWKKNNIELIQKLKKLKTQLIELDTSLQQELDEYISNLENQVKKLNLTRSLIKKLKQIKTNRQVQLNYLLDELIVNVKTLKNLNSHTKGHYKLTIKKINLQYTLDKILKLNDEKKFKWLTKGQKLISLNTQNKIDEGYLLIEKSKDNNDFAKLEKFENLKFKILKLDEMISLSNKVISEETNKYYLEIEKTIIKIENLKPTKLENFKNQYYNDIHSLEIKMNLIKQRMIL